MMLAVEIPIEALTGLGLVVGGGAGGFLKVIWDHRELKKTTKGTEEKALTYRELLDEKDRRIESLTNANATMAAEYARKVEELSKVTIQKVEEGASANRALLERFLTGVGELTTEIRLLRRDQNGGTSSRSRSSPSGEGSRG